MATTKWIEYRVISAKFSCSRVDEVRFWILGQYDDYSKACQKLAKSLNTSTLESESDSIIRKRARRRSQKRKPAAASQSSSSDNSDSESSGDNETGHPKISGT
ncbi:hypothetical protein Ocin01_19124, partial [Orchesella cincta]